jgi:hypothetical protein
VANDLRLEAGARARCAFHGLNPDEPALEKGNLIPFWKMFVAEVRVVLEAADAADQATPAMEQAGVAALKSGAPDTGGLVHKVWLAMSAIRGS